MGLPALQNRRQTKVMIDVLAFEKLFRRVDGSGGESPIRT
jgi:hypothetical protein